MRYDLVSSIKTVDLGTVTWGKTTVFYGYPPSLKGSPSTLITDHWGPYKVVRIGDPTPSDDGYFQIQYDTSNGLYFRFKAGSIYESMTKQEFKDLMTGVIATYISRDEPRRFDMMRPQANLAPVELFTIEGYTVSTTGAPAVNVNYNATDFIEIKPNTTYKWTRTNNYAAPTNTTARLCIYNDSKTFLTYYELSTQLVEALSTSFTTPGSAKYIRLSMRKTDTNVRLYETNPKRFNFVNDTAQVDLGSVTWTQYPNQGKNYTFHCRIYNVANTHRAFLSGYKDDGYAVYGRDKTFVLNSTGTAYMYVSDTDAAGMSAAEFKTFMSGKILTYQSTLKETL